MTPERLAILQTQYAANEPATRRFVVACVFREASAAIPAMAPHLDALLELDRQGGSRDALLAEIGALEPFLESDHLTAAIAAQQAAGLLDPRVVGPLERAAAAIETATFAYAERSAEDDASERWERDCLDRLRVQSSTPR